MRRIIALILLGIPIMLFVTEVSANDDTEDTIKTIDDLQTVIELLEVTQENNEDLQRLLDDPTNESLVGENIEKELKRTLKPFVGDVDDPQDVEYTMMQWMYLAFALAIFKAVILPILLMFH